MADARSGVEPDEAADAVQTRILARYPNRLRVDIAGYHALPHGFGGREGENARPGADVEHVPGSAPPQFPRHGQKASLGGAVMAGAEGERGLDLDGEVVGPALLAVVGPMHQEAAGAHGPEA